MGYYKNNNLLIKFIKIHCTSSQSQHTFRSKSRCKLKKIKFSDDAELVELTGHQPNARSSIKIFKEKLNEKIKTKSKGKGKMISNKCMIH